MEEKYVMIDEYFDLFFNLNGIIFNQESINPYIELYRSSFVT